MILQIISESALDQSQLSPDYVCHTKTEVLGMSLIYLYILMPQGELVSAFCSTTHWHASGTRVHWGTSLHCSNTLVGSFFENPDSKKCFWEEVRVKYRIRFYARVVAVLPDETGAMGVESGILNISLTLEFMNVKLF